MGATCNLRLSARRLLLVVAVLGVLSHSSAHNDPQLLYRGHRSLLGVAQPKHRACGTATDNAAVRSALHQAEAATYITAPGGKAALAAAAASSPFPAAGLALPLTFHVVRGKDGFSSATDRTTPAVTAAQLQRQAAVLNADYAGTGIQFLAPQIKWHTNDSWLDCWNQLNDILAAVNKPGETVNIVVCDLASTGGLLGFMPAMPAGFNELDASQAVAIDFRSMPGGPYLKFSGGRTLTHELGHFFGLLHVFGSCDPNGADGIPDTPAQSTASSGCPTGKDSCPDQPGEDAVTNFMDYSEDACMTGFTAGQAARMQAVMLQFRPTLMAAAQRAAAAKSPPPLKAAANKAPPPPPKPTASGKQRAPPPARQAVPGSRRRSPPPPARKRVTEAKKRPPPLPQKRAAARTARTATAGQEHPPEGTQPSVLNVHDPSQLVSTGR